MLYLSVTPGTWDKGTLSYQWQIDYGFGFVDAVGETGTTIGLPQGLEGIQVRCIETATSGSVDAAQNSNNLGTAPTPSSVILWDDGGNAPADIYIYDDAAPIVLDAANYLADVMEDSSGVRPTVTQSGIGTKPARSILIGYPVLAQNDEIVMYSGPLGQVVLSGKDVFDPNNPNWVREVTETNYMSSAGTYHAVMTFIQEKLGVVNAWPGAYGEVVPTATTKTLTPFFKRHKPNCLIRNCFGFSTAGTSSPYSLSKAWLKKQRNFYSLLVSSGHGFDTYFDRYHPDGTPGGARADLFALQYDSTRSGYPGGHNAKMEVGEPDLVNVWFGVNVTEALTARPLQKSFATQFNDGHSTGHSLDPRATAWDYTGGDADLVPLYWSGHSGSYPALTDREMVFSNLCAARVEAEHPTEDYYVTMLAYGPTLPAPKRETPADNLIVVNVANDFNNPLYQNGLARARFDAWLTAAPQNQVWRPNIGNGHGHGRGMWLTHVHEIGERFKTIVGQGVIGFTPDQFWEHWSTQWPMYYVMSQLLWDDSQDIDTLLDDAYTKLFGGAAANIKAYYEATEAIIVANRMHNVTFDEMLTMWSGSVLTTLQGHLTAAVAATTVATPERFRVEWVQAGLDWSIAIMDCIAFAVDYEFPYEVSDPTNLVSGANAIETDVDSVAGWGYLNPGFGTTISQSAETNGSNFAFLVTANGGAYGITRTLPGTGSDLYIVSVDVKGDGTRWSYMKNSVSQVALEATVLGWRTVKMWANGGDVVMLRELNNEDNGSLYVDNFKVQAATALNLATIESDWNAVVAAANAIRTDAKWVDCPPIGSRAAVPGIIPTVASHADTQPDPDYE